MKHAVFQFFRLAEIKEFPYWMNQVCANKSELPKLGRDQRLAPGSFKIKDWPECMEDALVFQRI